jgi:hypothetical protein
MSSPPVTEGSAEDRAPGTSTETARSIPASSSAAARTAAGQQFEARTPVRPAEARAAGLDLPVVQVRELVILADSA